MSQQITEEEMTEIATMISEKLNHRFCLIVFPEGDQDGIYISNAKRGDMILFLKETLNTLSAE
jgi:hypothetical protein